MDPKKIIGGAAVGLLVLGGITLVLITQVLGSRVCSAELPAPTGESVLRCDLEESTPYRLYVTAKNVPSYSTFHIEGRVLKEQEIRSFTFGSSRYENWSWETQKGSTEWHTERVGEFTTSTAGPYEIVLDKLQIEEEEYAEQHTLYIWTPMVDL